jgi:hypothetical protein
MGAAADQAARELGTERPARSQEAPPSGFSAIVENDSARESSSPERRIRSRYGTFPLRLGIADDAVSVHRLNTRDTAKPMPEWRKLLDIGELVKSMRRSAHGIGEIGCIDA